MSLPTASGHQKFIAWQYIRDNDSGDDDDSHWLKIDAGSDC